MHSFFTRYIQVFLLCLVFSVNPICAAQEKDVVFYPTDVSKAGDLAYLRDSVRLMLASRLAGSAGIQPRFEEGKSRRTATYYQVQSRLVSDANGVLLSASVLIPSADSPLTFQATASDDAQVMKVLKDLAAELGESLFDVQARPDQIAVVQKAGGATDFHTPHPDRELKANTGYGLAVYQEADNVIPVRTTGLHKSAVLPGRVKSMTAGDIDGDGLLEILLASDGELGLYQMRHGRVQHLDTVSLPADLKVNGLNVADVNGNGIAEIYISATRQERANSFVLEWSLEKGVSWLHNNVPRYLRPLQIPGKGVRLVAQKSGVEGLVSPGIFLMDTAADGELVDGAALTLPESVNLFEFVFADTNGNGSSEVVVINKKWQIEIYSAGLTLLFTTESGYGGRDLFLGLSKLELEDKKIHGMDNEAENREYVYVPIRLVAADINNDGRDEIVFVQNERYSSGWLSDSLLFRNGVVRMLTWDSGGLVELFHTNTVLNSITDFQLLMEPGTGEDNGSGRLVVMEPGKGDALTTLATGGKGTRVLVYDLDFSRAK